eukprot:1155759-Pelagomonas_calceolata.AAC.2
MSAFLRGTTHSVMRAFPGNGSSAVPMLSEPPFTRMNLQRRTSSAVALLSNSRWPWSTTAFSSGGDTSSSTCVGVRGRVHRTSERQ